MLYLATVLAQLHERELLGQGGKGASGSDFGELAGVSHQYHLGPAPSACESRRANLRVPTIPASSTTTTVHGAKPEAGPGASKAQGHQLGGRPTPLRACRSRQLHHFGRGEQAVGCRAQRLDATSVPRCQSLQDSAAVGARCMGSQPVTPGPVGLCPGGPLGTEVAEPGTEALT